MEHARDERAFDPARRALARLAVTLAAVGVVAVAAAPAAGAVTLPPPLPPIDIPILDPILDPPTTTTTAPPPTTTSTDPPPPTTTTTAPATTTTTAPSTTTTRPGTTTTTGVRRPGAAATSAAGSGTSGSGPSAPGVEPQRAARKARAAGRTGVHRGATSAAAAGGTQRSAASAPAVAGRSISRPGGIGPTTDPRAALGEDRGPNRTVTFAGIGVLLAAATGIVIGLHRRDGAHRRAAGPPRPRRTPVTTTTATTAATTTVGAGSPGSPGSPGTLHVARDRSERDVRAALLAGLAAGPVRTDGSDCRALQTVVKVAAREGLEVRDPDGFVVAATHRLARAYGSEPERKRLPLRWSVEVTEPTVAVPSGYEYLLERTGPDESGRRLAFAPGTELLLWDGGCL